MISRILLSALSALLLAGVVDGIPAATRSPSPPVPSNSEGANVISTTKNPGKLRIKENTSVCETKPGVYSASGYGDLSDTESIWFWYFASRNDPDNAPLSLWFNGGPGSSSMNGLFQEIGPCRITNDSSTIVDNPYSWTNDSNVLFIDQPLGTGFSVSHSPLKITTSQEAAADVWKFLQIFFSDSRFSSLASKKLALWTQSYGGHWGPAFGAYFLSQNAAIDAGEVDGVKINLQVLGIGNGLTDSLSQWPGYIDYATSNPYHALAPESVIQNATEHWSKPGGCKELIEDCYNTGANSSCSSADEYCHLNIFFPLIGTLDPYDVRVNNTDAYPANFTTWINDEALRSKIGAEAPYVGLNVSVLTNFGTTGDFMRNFANDLQTVIDADVRTIVYAGDADFRCNYKGVEQMVDNLNTKFTSEYAQQPWSNFTVDGVVSGIFKNAGTFSYLRIFGAGHEAPAYTYGGLAHGQATFEMFKQIMNDKSIGSA